MLDSQWRSHFFLWPTLFNAPIKKSFTCDRRGLTNWKFSRFWGKSQQLPTYRRTPKESHYYSIWRIPIRFAHMQLFQYVRVSYMVRSKRSTWWRFWSKHKTDHSVVSLHLSNGRSAEQRWCENLMDIHPPLGLKP